jgi:hypothetical protein
VKEIKKGPQKNEGYDKTGNEAAKNNRKEKGKGNENGDKTRKLLGKVSMSKTNS